jgi:hypothetical protein
VHKDFEDLKKVEVDAEASCSNPKLTAQRLKALNLTVEKLEAKAQVFEGHVSKLDNEVLL